MTIEELASLLFLLWVIQFFVIIHEFDVIRDRLEELKKKHEPR